MEEKKYLLTPSLLREVENAFPFFKHFRCLYEDFSQNIANGEVVLRVITDISLYEDIRIGFFNASTSSYFCYNEKILEVSISPATTHIGDVLKDVITLPQYFLLYYPTSSNSQFREYVVVLIQMPIEKDIKDEGEAQKHILEIKNMFQIP